MQQNRESLRCIVFRSRRSPQPPAPGRPEPDTGPARWYQDRSPTTAARTDRRVHLADADRFRRFTQQPLEHARSDPAVVRSLGWSQPGWRCWSRWCRSLRRRPHEDRRAGGIPIGRTARAPWGRARSTNCPKRREPMPFKRRASRIPRSGVHLPPRCRSTRVRASTYALKLRVNAPG